MTECVPDLSIPELQDADACALRPRAARAPRRVGRARPARVAGGRPATRSSNLVSRARGHVGVAARRSPGAVPHERQGFVSHVQGDVRQPGPPHRTRAASGLQEKTSQSVSPSRTNREDI